MATGDVYLRHGTDWTGVLRHGFLKVVLTPPRFFGRAFHFFDPAAKRHRWAPYVRLYGAGDTMRTEPANLGGRDNGAVLTSLVLTHAPEELIYALFYGNPTQ